MTHFTPAFALAGLSTLALVASSGCVEFGPTYKLEQTLSAAHVAGMPIAVKTGNGAISIQAHAGSAVEITARLRSADQLRLEAAQVNAVRGTDGTLTIDVTWPDGTWRNRDGCSFDILVPDVNGITATSSNGRLTFTGLSGALDAMTSNGRITITSHDGPITADTSNGRITITDATGAVVADTSNGRITVSLTDDNPGPVNLDTSNGSITLSVGPAFAGQLNADTSNGRVTFGPFPEGYAVSNQRVFKLKGRATFGTASGTPSVIDTSNGSIKVIATSDPTGA